MTRSATFALWAVWCLLPAEASSQERPRVRDGAIDLSGWDFERDGRIAVNGRWHFHHRAFLDPSALPPPTNMWAPVPGSFSDAVAVAGAPTGIENQTFGTYVVKLQGLRVGDNLGLSLWSAGSAYRLYWLQPGHSRRPKLVRGVVDREHSVPLELRGLAAMTVTATEAILMIHVVNHHNVDGGLWDPIWLGQLDDVYNKAFLRIDFEEWLLGAIFALGIFNLVLFLYRRDNLAPLFLGIACFSVFVVALNLDQTFETAYPVANERFFVLKNKLTSMATLSILGCLGSFLQKNFPHDFPAWLDRLTWLICVTLAAIVVILPYPAADRVLFSASMLGAFLLLAFLFYITSAAWMRRPGAGLSLLGMVFFAASCVTFTLAEMSIFYSSWALQHGVALFLFFNTFIAAHRFASASRRAETLTENLQQEVAAQTTELERQRREAVGAKAEVERAHQQLKTLDEQKTRFFQTISHELRTPLTLILNPAEALAADDPNARIILRNARRMLDLVNQLLELQRLTAVDTAPALEAVDLNEVAAVCGSMFESGARGRGLRFRIVRAERAVVVGGDPEWLTKIVLNYLMNALKHASTEVVLEVRHQDGQGRVAVLDDGPGIPDDERAQLFQLFSRLSNAKEVGSGLGLALAKELATAMGGTVGVDTPKGGGSAFWCMLPLSDATPKKRRQDLVQSLAFNDVAARPTEGGGQPPGTAPTILIVDDNADMRKLVADMFAEQGYRVITCADGDQALSVARQKPPALMITDWMMPDTSGPELIAAFRANARLRPIPVILLTARSDDGSRIEGTLSGADGFISKPFSRLEIVSLVKNLLTLKEREQALVDAFAALQQAQQRMIEQARLAALGSVVAGFHHEIGNPLNFILGGSQVARARAKTIDDPRLRNGLELIEEGASRIRDVVRNLDDFMGSNALELMDVDVDKEVDGTLALIRHVAEQKDIELSVDTVPGIVVQTPPGQLRQVLLNLLLNAIEAIGTDGRITVEARRVEASVEIQIADDGPGIPEALREQVFQPFFSTKRPDEGSGLGLAVSHELLTRLGGELTLADSETGTRFVARLPAKS